ncbi:AAA family ATPase [Sphaerisporangium sp. B11E5]|uniref:AAA family ATPase n=1 Tax=Sphaerisporangium sp. B11E5 TaxID=3153563 RepID=UPI00325F582F
MTPDSITPEPHRTQVTASTRELRYPAGSLVLLAGLPGAGKSTLLQRLYDMNGDETLPLVAGDVRVVDSRQARNWWARFLGPVPPRVRTPLVHATHVARIARAVLHGHAVVAHTRGTWPHILHGFAWLTRRRGAATHVILLDVPPQTARAGQYSRGRVVTDATFARHCRRWQALVAAVRATGTIAPAASITLLDREAADRLHTIRFDAAP